MPYYQKTITVVADDLDELAHVNNVRYLQWIQEISKEHWQDLVSLEIQNTMVWVVMRHEIDYKNAAVLNDVLRLKTHIGQSRGALSQRVVEIRSDQTNELIVRSNTKWCLLNRSTFKPMRIPSNIIEIFEGDTKNPKTD